jgi:hypothetical protein
VTLNLVSVIGTTKKERMILIGEETNMMKLEKHLTALIMITQKASINKYEIKQERKMEVKKTRTMQ